MNSFPSITLLITHYNRSSSLQRLLECFQHLDCHFGDIIVADDGSKEDQLKVLEELSSQYPITVITSPVNRGLGHNLNKGHDAVNTPYTLYVQEDFIPSNIFPEKLARALMFMEEMTEIDMVRFYAYFKYPYLKAISDGFSEMIFSAWPWYSGYRKFYFYSDHPHLKRKNFFERFGRYKEGLKGDVTEYMMMMSVIKNRGRALYYDDFKGLFDQVNSDEEPSTMERSSLRNSSNIIISAVREVYRHLKFNFDYHT